MLVIADRRHAWGMMTMLILALTLVGAFMAPLSSSCVESSRQHYGGRHEVKTAVPLSSACVESSRLRDHRRHNIKTATIQLATISVYT